MLRQKSMQIQNAPMWWLSASGVVAVFERRRGCFSQQSSLVEEGEEAGMQDVHSSLRITGLDNTRYVDLARA